MQTTNLNRVEPADLEYLRSFIPAKRMLVGADISPDYAHDELGGVKSAPDVLIRVQSAEEVSKILSYANKRLLPVVTRGAGTGLVGGAVAVMGGIMIETTPMNRILELDEQNMTVTVEPGVLLMDLAKYVQERGYMYPPDPGETSATIGGNISTNAGGMRAVKYGVTRDYVLSLTAVLPTGEIETFGSKVVKNSSGYSIKDLLIGSEGTLAVIVSATLKIIPFPKEIVSLLAPFPTFQAAVSTVPELIRSGTDPTAVEFLTREVISLAEDYLGKRFPRIDGDTALLLTYDGFSAQEVRERMDRASELCIERGAYDVYIVDTEERRASVWTARGAFLEAIKSSTTEFDECDVVVPRSKVVDFTECINELSGKLGLRIPYFGHAGDGNLHVYFCRDGLDEDVWGSKLQEGFDALYSRAVELGGMVSGEHGIGFAKREYLAKRLGPTQMELMRRIKKAFDPNGVLNPQKVCT
ncbi:MAG TPA: FAD-binding oxidoreductase [Firmicutes bacterium]|nr:FAD-binding oxidoreductase [Candidatus Fermentithermobacillaceae bacterium]